MRESAVRVYLRREMSSGLVKPVLIAALVTVGVALPSGAAGKAKRVTISGKAAGAKSMRLVATTPKGAARSEKLRKASFRLKVRGAAGTRLQLIGADGRYFGPIILGKAGKRRAFGALSGKRSVKLGKLSRGRGFYEVRKRLPAKALSQRKRDLVKLTKRGAPAGAGRLGFRPPKAKTAVRPRGIARAGQSELCEPGADADRDGIPNSLDADASGNGRLNIVDWDNASYNRSCPTNTFAMTWANRHGAANVNGGFTAADVAQFVQEHLLARFSLSRDAVAGQGVESGRVNCELFPWCETATFNTGTGDEWVPNDEPLWSEHDFGLVPNAELSDDPDFQGGGDPGSIDSEMRLRATPDQISPSDVVVYEAQLDQGAPALFPDILGAYLLTTPAIFRIETGKGTVHEISYPLEPGDPGAGNWIDAEGTHHPATPIELDDTTLALSVWRPQRPVISGAEAGEWRDMGGLRYWIYDPSEGMGGADGFCPASSISGLSPTLERAGDMIEDAAPDAIPDPGSFFNLTVDMAACAGGRANLPDATGLGFFVELASGGNAASTLELRFPPD